MNSDTLKILEMAVQVAARLPTEVTDIVARAIRESPGADSPAAKTHIAQDVPHPYYRDIATDFVTRWKEIGQHLSSEQLALILLTAEHADEAHRRNQAVELVWTGPDVHAGPFRRTEQAILQVLDSAQQRITLVSYAVYRIPHISEALVRAAKRGARIRIIVETPNLIEGQGEYERQVSHAINLADWPCWRQPHATRNGIAYCRTSVRSPGRRVLQQRGFFGGRRSTQDGARPSSAARNMQEGGAGAEGSDQRI